jgi:hypothetical protein
MSTQKTSVLLYFYGAILLLCGILGLIFVGLQVNITIIAFFLIAVFSGAIGFFMSRRVKWAFWTGLIMTTLMMFFFGWCVTKEGHTLIDMLQNGAMNLKPYNTLYQQGNLVVLSMVACVLSIVAALNQFIRASENGSELNG